MAAIFNRKENATDKYPIINDPNTFILSTIPMEGSHKQNSERVSNERRIYHVDGETARPPMSIWIMPNAIKNIKIPHHPEGGGFDGGHRAEDTKGL